MLRHTTSCLLLLGFALFVPALAWPQAVLPDGFEDSVVLRGLNYPVSVRFAADGRVFVAEKWGKVKVFPNVESDTATTFADLRVAVNSFGDRGLLGLALHPDFPATPWVYVLYTLDAPIGGKPPLYGGASGISDNCPSPDGSCPVGARLSRLTASRNTSVLEEVLIENWCNQFKTHSIGDLRFGPDGALYLSAGNGESENLADYGQFGNVCGDPPAGPGGVQAPATSLGGALRGLNLGIASDPKVTYAGRLLPERVTYGGKILRVDQHGLALPDNPLPDDVPGKKRIIAYGARQPFRFTFRPGTNELWFGDVGWGEFEEINRIANPLAAPRNFGWPCYEGPLAQPAYRAANLGVCGGLYAAGAAAVEPPVFAYRRSDQVIPGENCRAGTAAISGLAFHPSGGSYPPGYKGALFFVDASRGCMWRMLAGPGGLPDPATVQTFATGIGMPVALEFGPGGDLYYVDLRPGVESGNGGQVHRIRYFIGNRPPSAELRLEVDGFSVRFDGTRSSDPDFGDALAFAWDLDGDGAYDDAFDAAPVFTYAQPAAVTVGLRVTDQSGASDVATRSIRVPNSAPVVAVAAPLPSTRWRVGDTLTLAGSATDAEDGPLPPSAFTWSVLLHHCPNNQCHTHPLEALYEVDRASLVAPDHEYPSFLEVILTAVDKDGLATTQSVQLQPLTVDVTLLSEPTGLDLALGGTVAPAPFTSSVIIGSTNSIGAASPQQLGARALTFASWSDGGAQGHTFVAGPEPATWIARFVGTCGDGVVDLGESCDDGNAVAGDGCEPGCAATCTPGAPGACDDGDPCTVDACAADATCVREAVTTSSDLARQSALCLAQRVPAALSARFANACAKARQASALGSDKKARALRTRAARSFASVSKGLVKAAKKKAAMSRECAGALSAIAAQAREQMRLTSGR